MKNEKKYTYENTQMAEFLTKQLDAISSSKTQRDVANELGYKSPNIISMFKRGEIKAPLGTAHDLARAIGADPKFVFRLALMQHFPDNEPEDLIGNQASDEEMKLVKLWRSISWSRKDLSRKFSPCSMNGEPPFG